MISKALAYNRPSPINEDEYIEAYKYLNPSSKRKDMYDIACVTDIYGVKGHALMHYSDNRSNDDELHLVYDFIADSELEKYF